MQLILSLIKHDLTINNNFFLYIKYSCMDIKISECTHGHSGIYLQNAALSFLTQLTQKPATFQSSLFSVR